MKSRLRFFICTVVIIALKSTMLLSQNIHQQSVLASGEWYKLGIAKSGMYKLDYSFLKKLGLLKSNLDPQNIRIYGNGGSMLPQSNSIDRPDDLLENAIYIEGQQDHKFDKQDFILFYGQGPHVPTFNTEDNSIRVTQNIYSDTSYYFITVADSPGIRITEAPLREGGTEISSFDDFIYHEVETTNILSTTILESTESGSGREWYGEEFDFTTVRTFNLSLEGYLNGTTLNLFSSVLGCSTSGSSFAIKLNDALVGTQSFAGLIEGIYNSKGEKNESLFTIVPTLPDPSNVLLEYNYDKKSNSEAKGFLNSFTLNFKRNLSLYNSQTCFRSFESLQNLVSKFKISGINENTNIWEITDITNPQTVNYLRSGVQGEFSALTDQLKEFIVFDKEQLDHPISFGKVQNQNLHGLPSADMVIITHPLFLSQAKQLADFRQSHGLTVNIATIREIYNEFSSGKQDISAIRDFLRLQYQKENQLKYVLLMGDCSFDYKNRVKNNTNYVPVYESRESLHPIRSYSSDDYYGFMETNEGEWVEDDQGDHTLEIAIGRIPCKTEIEASFAVSKIINYSNNKNNLGNWRNRITFVADDGDANTHLNDADKLSVKIDTGVQQLNIKKIYLDAFPQESSPNVTSLKTKEAIHQAVSLGTLILNYTGHGGETGWTNEKILETSDIKKWDNKEKLPVIVTATCEFGKYDDPRQFTAAEAALLNPKGGAIALVTTTRPVFSSTNYILNKAFYEAAFKKIEDRMPTLGEIMIYTKNKSLNGSINRNFALLGDPSLTISYPSNSIEIQKINNVNIEEFQDTLKALSTVTLSGVVTNENNLLTTFNGILEITLFDKPTLITTLGNENPVTKYSTRETVIFKGRFSIKKGMFSFSFTLPKNINYQYGKGKISLYAFDINNYQDATGDLNSVMIGGSSSTFVPENNPPNVVLFLNDSTFKSGDHVQAHSILKAKIWDDSGINITSTIVGQDLKAILASEETQEIVLNDYFEPSLDDYKSGIITYPFDNLKTGKYLLTLKVWDIFNNSNETSIEFYVVEDKPININQLLNFPNPFSPSIGTTFSFSHDRPGEDLEIMLSIYDVEGRMINNFKFVIYKSDRNINEIRWNGTDSSGNKISDGLYIYRLELRSLTDKNKSYRSGKLLLIN